jgi:DNA repair exonuclease SbcCD ATPase subunit
MANARGKFVAISDLHAHPWAAFSEGDGGNNTRLRRTLQVLSDSLAMAREADVPWVFAGDIVHTAGYALNVVLSGLISVLDDYPDVLKVAVWGNHDARGVGSAIRLDETVWASILKSVDNLHVLDPTLGETVEHGGILYGGIGSQPKTWEYELGACDVGIYHGIVKGSIGPNSYVFEEGLDPDKLVARHRLSVVGDLHHPQYREPKKGHGILVPGSPEHHNFGDAGDHGWWLVTLGKESVAAKFVSGGSAKFLTVDTLSEVKKGNGSFYRVRTVQSGEVVPDGVEVISSTPTVIEARAAMSGMSDEEVIEAWLKADPPQDDQPERAEYFTVGRELLRKQERIALRAGRLTNLRLRNFGSYEDQDFPIEPGVHLVLGTGRDFNSNGAGKSTLFEAAFWLITGRTTKGLSGDDVIRRDNTQSPSRVLKDAVRLVQGCRVEGKMSFSDGESVTVIRERGAGGGHTLRVLNDAGDSMLEAASVIEATKALMRWLGVSQELIQMTSYLSQEQVTMFSTVTDGPRKEMVGSLIGLSAYQEASVAAGDEVRTAQKLIDTNSAISQHLEVDLKEEQGKLQEAAVLESNWEDGHAERLAAAEGVLAQHDLAAGDLQRAAESEYVERALLGVRKRMEALEVRKQELASLELSSNFSLAAANEALADAETMLATAREELTKVAVTAEEAKKMVVWFNERKQDREAKLEVGICPECGQSIDPEHVESCLIPFRKELEEALSAASSAVLNVPSAKDAVAQARVVVNGARQEAEVAQHVASRDKNLAVINQDLADLDVERASTEAAAIAQASAFIARQREALEKEIKLVLGEQNPHSGKREASDARLAELSSKISGVQTALAAHSRSVLLHEYWQKGFSRTGVQSLLLDELAAAFNEARGGVFPALTQGVYDAQLSTQSKTKSGELREKTDILVYEHGKQVPYEGLSGGERQRIDVGVMLTLIKAISRWMQVPGVLGWLVLDEVFKFLDDSGAEGVAEALREVQEVVPAVYVVTHDPQFQALFSSVLRVGRGEDGVSRLSL